MPELPEVETVVRQLGNVLPGKTVAKIAVLREKSFSGNPDVLIGKTISSVSRVAKMIVIEFEDSSLRLLGHLKMTGQMVFEGRDPSTFEKHATSRLAPSLPSTASRSRLVQSVREPTATEDKQDDKTDEDSISALSNVRVAGGHPTVDWMNELPSKHTRVVMGFENGSTLYFNDQRVFGWLKIVNESEYEQILSHLPPDVVDEGFDVELLWRAVKSSRRAIKLIILDQKKMGGMGNIYANDALWMAGIKPERRGTQIRKYETERLHEAMVAVINRAIEVNGSTYSHFVDTQGVGGSYQDEFKVYDREEEHCLREGCEGVICKVSLGGRGTYWCPLCQV